MLSFEPFRWQAQKSQGVKRPRDENLPFRPPQDLEDDVIEEEPPPLRLKLHLEDNAGKCKRLTHEGSLLAEAERYAEALKHWEDALLFAPNSEEEAVIHELMGQGLLLLGRSFEAVQAADKAVSKRPAWYCGHLTRGRALLEFGEIEEAVRSFQQAAALAPNEMEVTEELHDAERLATMAQARAQSTEVLN